MAYLLNIPTSTGWFLIRSGSRGPRTWKPNRCRSVSRLPKRERSHTPIKLTLIGLTRVRKRFRTLRIRRLRRLHEAQSHNRRCDCDQERDSIPNYKSYDFHSCLLLRFLMTETIYQRSAVVNTLILKTLGSEKSMGPTGVPSGPILTQTRQGEPSLVRSSPLPDRF